VHRGVIGSLALRFVASRQLRIRTASGAVRGDAIGVPSAADISTSDLSTRAFEKSLFQSCFRCGTMLRPRRAERRGHAWHTNCSTHQLLQ